MEIRDDIKGKPGVSIPRSIKLRRKRDMSPQDAADMIAEHYKKLSKISEETRSVRNDEILHVLRHRKAMDLVKQVENQIRNQKGQMKFNLTIEDNSGDPRPSYRRREKEYEEMIRGKESVNSMRSP